ncbi:hypothetical protein MTO96_015936 [Rhipicephalus appendiculatus]
MEDVTTELVDITNADVQKLYRKGLRRYRGAYKSPRQVETSMIAEYDAALAYKRVSEKDAAVLHRMLRSGLPARSWAQVFFGVFRRLYALELSCANAGSQFANEIASYIEQNKSLRELRLFNSCGGDEGAAVLIEALAHNATLKVFALNDIESSSDTVIGFAKMLAINRTLEIVRLTHVGCEEVDKVWSVLAQERYAGVFERLDIVWPDELLPVLTELLRREACYPALAVKVTSSVDEGVLREFFDAAAQHKTLRRLYFESDVFDALANGIASVVKSTRTIREIYSTMEVQRGNEHQLITILNALKENTSITDFAICVETVTPEVATSLAELLAANKSLREIHLCVESDISPRIGKTILQALWANYALTELTVCATFDENDITHDIEALLNRNFRILLKAVDFVITGGDESDQISLNREPVKPASGALKGRHRTRDVYSLKSCIPN